MPQWRKLWTKTTDSLDLNDMPDDFMRLAWVLLPLVLDKNGRGLDNLAWVRSNLFPLREDVTLEQIAEAMDWWAVRGMIDRYTVNGRQYFRVLSFADYQGDTSREAESRIPPPPDYPPKSAASPDSDCDDGDGDDNEGQELVESKSGVSPDLVLPKSSTEADVEADLDADVEAEADAPAQKRRGPPTPATAALTDEQEIALEQLLTVPGMDPATARKLVPRFDLTAVPGWVAEGRRAPPEFAAPLVISRLRDGAPPPRARDGPNEDDWGRFVSGEYAEYVQP